MDPILHIPTAEILDNALLRDRTALDPVALDELTRSIAADGLRQPVEIWTLSTPTETQRYGLIAGLRRLTACRALGHATIPAFLRTPQSVPHAMAQMVAENDIRTNPTPWETGLLLANCMAEALFPTLDEVIAALHPHASRQKRSRLRSLALVAEELDGTIATPTQLTTGQMEQLATALRTSAAPLIHQILTETRHKSLPTQWAALLPTLTERVEPSQTPTRPRRLLHLKQGLTIRRETCQNGYLLRFTGPEARKGGLIDDVLDKVEYWFQRE